MSCLAPYQPCGPTRCCDTATKRAGRARGASVSYLACARGRAQVLIPCGRLPAGHASVALTHLRLPQWRAELDALGHHGHDGPLRRQAAAATAAAPLPPPPGPPAAPESAFEAPAQAQVPPA